MNNKYLIYLTIIIILLGLFFDKDILFSTNTAMFLITLIAGLFGFMVALIPFTLQLFSKDNISKNEYLAKCMEKENFDFFIKPMFARFINMLRIMFFLFVYAFLLNILQTVFTKDIIPINIYYKITIIIFFVIYTILIIQFFMILKYIIRDLETLIFKFYKDNTKK